MRPPAPHHAITAAVVAVAAGLLALSASALLVMLPALVVAWMVAAGRFTGEQATAFVRRVVRRLQRRGPDARTCVPRRPRTVVRDRGGLLLARSIASRPPPALA